MRGRRHLGAIALALGLGLANTRPARAEGPADAAAAEALFQLGREALDEGQLDEACDRFRESYRLDPAGGTLLNLGVCEERRGHLAAAWEALRGGISKLPDGDVRTAAARSRLEAVDRRLPRLTVKLSPDAPAGTRVSRDGQIDLRSASLGVALPVDAGVHRVATVAPGHARAEIEVTLAEGERKEIVVSAGTRERTVNEEGQRSGQAPEAAPHASRPMSPIAIASFAGAGALAVAGTVFGALTIDARHRIHTGCDGTFACSSEGLGAVDDARRWGALSTASYVSAGVALATGVVVYLVTSARARSDRPLARGSQP